MTPVPEGAAPDGRESRASDAAPSRFTGVPQRGQNWSCVGSTGPPQAEQVGPAGSRARPVRFPQCEQNGSAVFVVDPQCGQVPITRLPDGPAADDVTGFTRVDGTPPATPPPPPRPTAAGAL